MHKAEHGGGEREYVTDGVSSCVEGEILLISAGYGLKTQKTTNHEPRGSFVRGLACFNQQNTYWQKNHIASHHRTHFNFLCSSAAAVGPAKPRKEPEANTPKVLCSLVKRKLYCVSMHVVHLNGSI